MGSETAIWSSLLVLVLVAIAAGAAIFGMISTARTWQISAQHEPFRALGWRRFAMGYAAVPYMPEAALCKCGGISSRSWSWRHLLAILAILWINTPRAG
jgi:hypothetical protein